MRILFVFFLFLFSCYRPADVQTVVLPSNLSASQSAFIANSLLAMSGIGIDVRVLRESGTQNELIISPLSCSNDFSASDPTADEVRLVDCEDPVSIRSEIFSAILYRRGSPYWRVCSSWMRGCAEVFGPSLIAGTSVEPTDIDRWFWSQRAR